MGTLRVRLLGAAIAVAAAVWWGFGAAQSPHDLPIHDTALLLVLIGLGLLLGAPALLVPVVGCVVWYFAAAATPECTDPGGCEGLGIVLVVFPFVGLAPVLAGAVARLVVVVFRRNRAR